MIEKIKAYIESNSMFSPDHKLLLAVSGGMDSMAMLEVLHAMGCNVVIAHCNFNLRGTESDADEQLVRSVGEQLGVPTFVKNFDTKSFANEKGMSVQMAARELRYAWFQELCSAQNCDFIVTAHHKNDVAETVLINLIQGTGLAGLHGILPQQHNIVRPMLAIAKEEIEAFVKQKNIAYREDTSNADLKYLRNAVRHSIVPAFEQLNPRFVEHIYKTTGYVRDAELILNRAIEEAKLTVQRIEGEKVVFSIKSLKQLHPLATYLYYFLRPYGFNESQIQNIIDGLDEHAGKTFFSPTHQLLKDREALILTKQSGVKPPEITINDVTDFEYTSLRAQIMDLKELVAIEDDPGIAYLDMDEMQFPLRIRTWQEGDRFQPIGMKGQKKVSDFLVDQKIARFDKENVQVLVSGSDICWLLNHRISDKFKIKPNTTTVLKLNVTKK